MYRMIFTILLLNTPKPKAKKNPSLCSRADVQLAHTKSQQYWLQKAAPCPSSGAEVLPFQSAPPLPPPATNPAVTLEAYRVQNCLPRIISQRRRAVSQPRQTCD